VQREVESTRVDGAKLLAPGDSGAGVDESGRRRKVGASTARPGSSWLASGLGTVGGKPWNQVGAPAASEPLAALRLASSGGVEARRRRAGGGPTAPSARRTKLCPPGLSRLTPGGRARGEAGGMIEVAGSMVPVYLAARQQGRTGSQRI